MIEVKSKANGKIIKMPVEQGDYLKEGQLIAEVEKTFTEPQVEQAEADLLSAKARSEQAKINIDLQKKQSETEISQKQEAVKTAKTELEKLQSQIENEKISNARELEDAKNNLNIAKLKLNKLQIGSRPEEIKRAESTLNQAKTNFEMVQKQYERLSKLGEQGYVSREDMDNSKTKFEDAKAQYELAVQNLELIKNPSTKEDIELANLQIKQAEFSIRAAEEKIKNESTREKDISITEAHLRDAKNALELALVNQSQIEIRKKEVESTEAQVVRARSALKEAKDRLKDTLVTAPISGTILLKMVEEGTVISSGISQVTSGATLVTMADLNKVYIKANVDETDIGKIVLNQPVKIIVDAFPKEDFKGKVVRIAPQGVIVQNVTTFEITLEIENPSSILKPGMNASLEIVSTNLNDIIFVPNDAIKEMQGKKVVFLIKDGKPIPQNVKTGISNWEFTEIVSGLSEGDKINKTGNSDKKGHGGPPMGGMGFFGGRAK
ncbi:efflux RND transporter periplasmic adaptor subunit [Candidatus Poribacteria bacterium]|nr:efflux RND transporter periplasmic adaptor subunit [Candidatus Poribacteria bacterium]